MSLMKKSSMNILFFYQYFGTPKGTWSTRVYEFARRWVDKGHSVTVVTAPYYKSDIKAEKFISRLSIDGINLIVINVSDSNKVSIFRRVINAIMFSLIASWYAIRLNYDLCISSSGPITIGIPMIVAKKLRKKLTIFEVRDLWPQGGIELGLIKSGWQSYIALFFEKLCYNNANHVVTASIGQKDFIIKNHPSLNITVIPNAADLELFNKQYEWKLPDWTKEMLLFTHIGSLGLIHNINYWMKVAKELKNQSRNNILLVFIGDGAEKSKYLYEKESNELNNIVFLGSMPKTELIPWVRSSIATLFATLDNPVQSTCSPNKIFDSFAASKPIIQTTKGWIFKLVENERCGLNVDVNSPRDAAKAICKLADNKILADEMGINAFRLAESEFSRDFLANKYLQLITELNTKY